MNWTAIFQARITEIQAEIDVVEAQAMHDAVMLTADERDDVARLQGRIHELEYLLRIAKEGASR